MRKSPQIGWGGAERLEGKEDKGVDWFKGYKPWAERLQALFLSSPLLSGVGRS